MKKSKIPAIGVPMVIDPKAVKKVPQPKPSRAQLVEALVMLKIEQVTKEMEAFDAETKKLTEAAHKALADELQRVPFGWYNSASLSINNYDGKTLCDVSLSFDSEKLRKGLQAAILAVLKRKNIRPVYSVSLKSWCTDEDDIRKAVRRDIQAQLAKKEGTNKDRLTSMLSDKTFRTAMENALAKLEGKEVVEAESQLRYK